MKQTDSEQILVLLTRLTEELIGPAKPRPRTGAKRALSERVDNLDTKVTGLGKKVIGLDKKVTGLDKKIGTSRRNVPIATQLDALDTKLGTSQRNIPIAVQLDALDRKVEHRFNVVDLRIDTARDQVVDLVTRVHDEVTKRVVGLEEPAHGRKGNGGRGSGGGGVPLAS